MIGIIDQSKNSGYTNVLGTSVAGALASQIAFHVAPSYGLTRTPVVWLGQNPSLLPKGAWPVYILDDPDTAGALGYHDLDPNGNPYGRVFVTPTLQAGVTLSSVLSHEVVEAFVDPYANLWADLGRVSVAFEACDPVESSSYAINGITVSNFVTRAWFDVNNKTAKTDWLGHLAARPFVLEHGGYLIYMQDGKVGQKFADDYPEWKKALKHSEQPSRTVWREVRELESIVL